MTVRCVERWWNIWQKRAKENKRVKKIAKSLHIEKTCKENQQKLYISDETEN